MFPIIAIVLLVNIIVVGVVLFVVIQQQTQAGKRKRKRPSDKPKRHIARRVGPHRAYVDDPDADDFDEDDEFLAYTMLDDAFEDDDFEADPSSLT